MLMIVELIHEDQDQIDDLDLEEMDINWQIAMTAIKIKKFYKKTGRRPRVDGKMHVAFDKRNVECFNCHNIWHFAQGEQVLKYGKYGPQPQSPSPTVSDASSTVYSTRHPMTVSGIGLVSDQFIHNEPINDHIHTFIEQVNDNTGHGYVSSVSSAGTKLSLDLAFVFGGKQSLSNTIVDQPPDSNVYISRGPQGQSQACEGLGPKEKLYLFLMVRIITEAYGHRRYLNSGDDSGHMQWYVADSHYQTSFWAEASVINACLYFNRGIGHRWMFDLDYLTDSMNYIPVSLQNQANPAGSKEVIDIDVQTKEAAELMVVSSTSLTNVIEKQLVGIFEKASLIMMDYLIDFNNLPDEVDVSTNHTLRIHNAHPQSQILGDPNTPVQTRSSLKKITEAHALVSYIQAQQRSNHKGSYIDFLLAFLSQSEPRESLRRPLKMKVAWKDMQEECCSSASTSMGLG
ncbi:hypothetical protein Tco_1311728 [Tanacetum coccineum]